MSASKSLLVDRRFADLAAGFPRYLDAYDGRGPFSGEQLRVHVRTIAIRRQLGSAAAAAASSAFAEALYGTLRAWGIGVRASKLPPISRFAEILREHVGAIAALDGRLIDEPDLLTSGLADEVWSLVESLPIVENQAKVVAGTKTLHHLLPDLVPPLDREWTGRFLSVYPAEWQPPDKQRQIFMTAFRGLAEVARTVNPQRFVGPDWRSSRTKVLDNALIGFCMLEVPGRSPRTTIAGSPRATVASTSGVYQPLHDWLQRQPAKQAHLTFDELESILERALPPSARLHRPWWANHAGNRQAQSWMAAGWRVGALDMLGKTITFVR